MKSSVMWLGVVLAGLILGGCASTGEQAGGGADVDEGGTMAGEGAGAETSAAGAGGTFQGHPLDDPDSPLSNRVFYFEFDSAQVAADDREVLQAHAEYLANHPEIAVTLEGHADERGSREYNIGLGERRAQSVRNILELQGVGGDQVRVVSYGEEKPAVEGHDESAWRWNRRVELVYPGH